MPASPDDRLQCNFKTPAGTLINIYAKDAAELSALLEDLEGASPQITAVEEMFRATAAAAPVAGPPSKQAAPFGDSAVPSCNHGARVFKSGTGKKGPWSAWMCPAQREDPSRCEPIWND